MKMFMNGIDLNGQKLVNVADPSAGTDGVNLQYLQAFVRGLSWKQPVRAASTANVSLASPGATLDGVTLVSGDRVLLKNQTAGAENGIYVWTGASAALTRATDADTAAELAAASVLVAEGTTNADKQFTQNTDNVTLGTTSLTWAQFGGGSAYTAGNGLSLTGGAFAVVPKASGGLVVDGTGVSLDTAVAVRKYAATIGGSTSIAVAHNLGTSDVTYSLRRVSDNVVVDTDATVTDANTLTLTFAAAPAAASLRVVVHG